MKALALMLAVAGWSYAGEAQPTEGMQQPGTETAPMEETTGVSGVEGDRIWAERRIQVLREDVDRFEKRLQTRTGDDRALERKRSKLDAIKERVNRLEDRFKAGEPSADQVIVVEEEIYAIDDDLHHLRRDTKQKR